MKLPGKKANADASNDKIVVGDLVCYDNQGALCLAVIKDQVGSKYSVVNDRGRTQDCPAQRLHKLPRKELSLSDGDEAIGTTLSAWLETAKGKVTEQQLQELWEVVYEDSREYSNKELSQLLLSEDSLESHLATRLALITNSTYFKRKKEHFVPRPAETVEELKKAAANQARKDAQRQAFVQWVVSSYKQSSVPGPEIIETLELFKAFAASAPLDNPKKKEVGHLIELIEKQLNTELPGVRERKVFNLLRRLDVFHELTNLAVTRHQLPIVFSPSIEQQAEELEQPDFNTYSDRTHLECFTIDDENTRDMDDAISIIKTESGYELGIYISDVAGLVAPMSDLDIEAKNRATSLYFFNDTVHMFPESIAENKASLVENQVRPVFACICQVSSDFVITNVNFELATIKNCRRYSYEEADELILHGNSPFDTLYSISTNREMQRFEAGGFRVTKPEIRFSVDKQNKLSISEFYEQSPARNLVGEFMILANEFMARFAAENNIPFVYRSQEPPDSPRPELPEGLTGPALQYLQRSGLRPSSTQVQPASHHMLGLDYYAQATSPIRRYLDLCNQRQLRSFLLNSSPYYSYAQLEEVIEQVNAPQKRAGIVMREAHRQLLLTYLWQNKKSITELKGTVLRTDMKHPLLELDKIYMPYVAKLKTPVEVGDERHFRIKRVDPVLDDFILEEIV